MKCIPTDQEKQLLLEEILPPERTEARRIARRAKTFVAFGNELYKRSPLGVLMKCVPTSSRSMPESADTTWPRGRWSEKPFAKVFTSPPRYEM